MRSKVLLFNPPGRVLIRGEGRSDSDTDPDTSVAAAKWIYPPMNLAYGAACLRREGFEPTIRDYPAERRSLPDLERELGALQPDLCITNLNPSSEREDLRASACIRRCCPSCKIIGYAPYLGICASDEIPDALLDGMDAFLAAEHPESLAPMARALVGGNDSLRNVAGILYRDPGTGELVRTPTPAPLDLDALPRPARDLLDNGLYLRPDNGRPQALVQTGRGCPFRCRFCLTPAMTGSECSQRSVDSVIEEIEDCVANRHIEQFFFRADTFTLNRKWVLDFAQRIIGKGLRISWCANSRSNCIDEEMAARMRRSGCWLLAFGFESGSPESLERCGKGVTLEDNERARAICKKQGILVHGQYIIGFPWEGARHIEETYAHIKRMRCDFIDVQLLVPYKGTSLYEEMLEAHPELIAEKAGSKIEGGIAGTANGLSKDDLLRYQRKMLRSTYLSPAGIAVKLLRIRSFAELRNYTRYGLKFVLGHFNVRNAGA